MHLVHLVVVVVVVLSLCVCLAVPFFSVRPSMLVLWCAGLTVLCAAASALSPVVHTSQGSVQGSVSSFGLNWKGQPAQASYIVRIAPPRSLPSSLLPPPSPHLCPTPSVCE